MFGAHMEIECFISPPLIVPFHFVKRVADGGPEDLNSQAQAEHAQP
jgi:hypothetical protein